MNLKITDVRAHPGDSAFLIDDGETAILYETICVSGGRVGLNVAIAPESLAGLTGAEFADLTR